jgi:DNA repair exonuclease SbcCD ATPase subunit
MDAKRLEELKVLAERVEAASMPWYAIELCEAARTALPELIAEVRRLQAELAESEMHVTELKRINLNMETLERKIEALEAENERLYERSESPYTGNVD